jgi:hypothetical protein
VRRAVVYARGPIRVVALDSSSMLDDTARGQVVISGSNGGAISGHMARLFQTFCVAFNDAGFGKEDAGVVGIVHLDDHGIAAVAVSHDSAEISNGLDMWESGVISRANVVAQELGLVEGRPLREALIEMLAALAPGDRVDPAPDGRSNHDELHNGDLR